MLCTVIISLTWLVMASGLPALGGDDLGTQGACSGVAMTRMA